jgi:uncharacterized membrane protein YcaP (DUF421 family)
MSDVWTLDISVVEKVVRTVLVYGGLAVLLRVAGKRNLAQLNSFDLIVVLLLSNVVQNALIGPDNSVTGALLGAVVLLTLNAAVARVLAHSDKAVRLFEGAEVALVKNGQFVASALKRQGLRRADVETALRAQGADGPGDVAEATLSPGGSIVVWLKPEEMSANHGDLTRLHQRLDQLERALVAELRRPATTPA